MSRNPPLVCCSLALTTVAILLTVGGWYLVNFDVKDYDLIWETAKNRTSGDFEQTMNSTGSIEEVYIGADQKATAQFRVNILAGILISIVLVIISYGCCPRREYKVLDSGV